MTIEYITNGQECACRQDKPLYEKYAFDEWGEGYRLYCGGCASVLDVSRLPTELNVIQVLRKQTRKNTAVRDSVPDKDIL